MKSPLQFYLGMAVLVLGVMALAWDEYVAYADPASVILIITGMALVLRSWERK